MPLLLVAISVGCGGEAPADSQGSDATEFTGSSGPMTAGDTSGDDDTGAGDSSGSSPPTGDPDPGAGSQTLTADIEVRASGESGGPLQTEFVVSLQDADDMAIASAAVTVAFAGESRVLDPDVDSPGTYRATASGYARVYGFDIERGADTLTGVVLVGPSVHEIGLDPTPALVDQPATVSWTPQSEPGVEANIFVFGLETNTTHAEGPLLDDGEAPLPAEAFPEPDDYFVRTERFTRRDLDGPATGTVRVILDLPTPAVP